MINPVFPRDFELNGCPEVIRAREYRKNFGLEPDPEDDLAYAQCAFKHTGEGFRKCFECENCRHRVYDKGFDNSARNQRMAQHYKDIQKYYREVDEYANRESIAKLIEGAHI